MIRLGQILLLFILTIFSSLTVLSSTEKCPRHQKPYILKKKPPVGTIGVSHTRAFFFNRKIDGSDAIITWCSIEKKSNQIQYKYKGSLNLSQISDINLSNKKEKKLFAKKSRDFKAIKIYFQNISRKRTILELHECSDKKITCSSGAQVSEFHSKIKTILSKNKENNCQRSFEKTCQGDPKPVALMNKKHYCEEKLYQPKLQRKYDFFIKASKPQDVSLNLLEKKVYDFIPSSSSKAILGSGYYLKKDSIRFNRTRPKNLWQWQKIQDPKNCSSLEIREIKDDISKEFKSSSYLNAYKKEANIQTNPGKKITKSTNKIAVFVLGAAASGKTTTTKRGISIAINNHFCPKGKAPFCNLEFTIIDGGIMRDVSRVWLDLKEIATDRGHIGFKDQYNIFSSEFKKLKVKLINEAISKGKNIVIPETAAAEFLKVKGGPVKSLMDKLHNKGYKILMTSIYVKRSQAEKFGKSRAKKEGKSYSSTAWLFSQEQTEILMNYARSKKYSSELPMYIFDNSKKYWGIKNPMEWFGTKGVKTTIPKNCTVKRSCQALAGTCKFKPKCS